MWIADRFSHFKSVSRLGWAAIMAGWSALLAVAANADLFVTKYASKSFQDRWDSWWHPHLNWQTWIAGMFAIAFLMVLEGSYRHTAGLEERMSRAEKKIKDIEDAKPCIVVRDVYTEKVSVNQNGLLVCIANVLRISLENAPPHPYPNSEAKNVIATISFYDHFGKLLIADMDARWTASAQPVGPHTESIVPLLGMDLGIGVKRDLDIAFAAISPYKAPSPNLVALNNDNFRFTCWERPDRVLRGTRFVAKVHVRAVWVDTKFSVEFWVLPYGEIEFKQLL